jgi:hypothetical protein
MVRALKSTIGPNRHEEAEPPEAWGSCLIGLRNRLSVVLNWAWAYATFQRGARLITGPDT